MNYWIQTRRKTCHVKKFVLSIPNKSERKWRNGSHPNLTKESKRLWDVKATVVLVVTEALWTVLECLGKSVVEMEIKGIFRTYTAVLRRHTVIWSSVQASNYYSCEQSMIIIMAWKWIRNMKVTVVPNIVGALVKSFEEQRGWKGREYVNTIIIKISLNTDFCTGVKSQQVQILLISL